MAASGGTGWPEAVVLIALMLTMVAFLWITERGDRRR